LTAQAYLADACALIVMLAGEAVGPELKRVLIEEAVYVSPVTVWEITHKASLGKLPAVFGPDGLRPLLKKQFFEPLPLVWDDAEEANRLPWHHKDPMDRMLIAQALRRDLIILTSDRIFADYGVKTLW
jgi:PIN domain nuclease of toxin-antitoxin system